MTKRNDIIVEWAINRIEREYKDDVSLLLTYGSYENGTSNPLSDVDFYFIPKTNRAYELCKTFILEEIGFDLFPMTWERVDGIAEFNEVITPCVGNVKILYCNSDEDKKRFEEIQGKLKKNLADKEFMLGKASQKIEDSMDLYKNMIFEENICDLRTLAGQIAMSLSDAAAYINQTYFSRGLKKQIEDLKNMDTIPKDFTLLYDLVVNADSAEQIREYCYRMIKNTKEFLQSKICKSNKEDKQPNYEELAGLYQEIVSTWNKIYVCCDGNDAALAYISGACLQNELNMAAIENGLDKIDLMSSYSSKNLQGYKARAMETQKEFVKMFEDNGVKIESYNNVEEFLKEN